MSKISHEQKVQNIFEKISNDYDKNNQKISLGKQKSWKKQFIADISEKAGKNAKILDLCCGTGDIAIGLAKIRKDVFIDAADFSVSMLNIAKEKSAEFKNISWKITNAAELDVQENYYDAVSISFGLRNTFDFEKVLTEISRVLKQGGHLFIMDSFVPEFKWIRPFYRFYFGRLMPFIGGGIKNFSCYRWLSESTENFTSKNNLLRLLKKMGYEKINCKNKMFGSCVMIEAKKITENQLT